VAAETAGVAHLDPAVRRLLADAVGAQHVLVGEESTAAYDNDWTGRFRGRSAAVVRPGTTAEVAAIIDICRRHAMSVVAQGGNTGLVGGGVPLHGELVVSLGRMATVGEVDVVARQITVGAGATLAAVRDAADRAGLAYAIDLGARDSATIGGTIATNAGGLNFLRHGGTREQLIGVEAVLGTGRTISHLGGLLKDNTGYHLPSLLCGSEGTLGIVTVARLRLATRHDHRVTALLAFGDVAAAVAAIGRLRSMLEIIEAAELFLDTGLNLVCSAFQLRPPFPTGHAVYVLVEVADVQDPTATLAAAVDHLTGVDDVAVAVDSVQRAALWRYREGHTTAINTIGSPHKLDVTLPLDRLAEFIETVPSIVAMVDDTATTWLFGHIGDGNIHVNVTGPADEDERVDDAVLRYVASLDGSISAEHGIGSAKRSWLGLGRSEAEIETMRDIKRALDPDRILNPNVLFG
jgi:FAD/FMN-containing dehydrogenase